jgi:Protein of unknown function (DUF3298)
MANFSSRNLFNIGFFFAALIVSLGCGALAPAAAPTLPAATPTSPAVPTTTPVPLFQQVSLTTIPSEEDSPSPQYKIMTQTPALTGSDDPRVKNFNAEMTALVTKAVSDFKQNPADPNLTPVSEGSSFDVQYKLLSPAGDVLSIKFDIEGYRSGAAHPFHSSQTINYDLEKGADLTLVGLFLPNSAYLQTISTYCAAQLKARDIGFDSGFSQGADPTPDHYRSWNITADGLLITFDEYQVAAYAAGPQLVTVPYSELKTLIDPQGPLENFIQ